MSESQILNKLRELEEEVEALRRAFQSVLFGEAVDAEHEGRTTLVEKSGQLDYDDYHAKAEEPANARLRRVIDRAHAILEEAAPRSLSGSEIDG